MPLTGFSLVDGDAARGIPSAKPHHWMIGLGIVIVAQWLHGWGNMLADLVSLVPNVNLGLSSPTALSVLAWNVIPFGIIAGSALYASWCLDQRGPRAVGLSWATLGGAMPWALVGLMAAFPTVLALIELEPGWILVAQEAMLVLLPATIIQAGAEEIVFRGIITTSLIARYGSLRGLMFGALLFALWHLQPGQGLPFLVYEASTTFVFGLTAGIVALRQGHIGGAIALHVIWNVAWGISAGFANGSAGNFWDTYLHQWLGGWAIETLGDWDRLQNALLPLMIETALMLVICKETILDIVARRDRTLMPQS